MFPLLTLNRQMWTRKAARLSLGVPVVLLSLLLTLNRFHTWFWYFHCWLWTSWVENVSVWIINTMNVRFQDKVQSGQKPFICFYLFCLIAYVNQISSTLKYVQSLNKNIHFVCEIRRSFPINSVKISQKNTCEDVSVAQEIFTYSKSTRKWCQICSKLTIKTPERRH